MTREELEIEFKNWCSQHKAALAVFEDFDYDIEWLLRDAFISGYDKRKEED